MSDVKLERVWVDNPLLCPCCEGNNLHPAGVHVHTFDNIELEFWCEECHGSNPDEAAVYTNNFRLHVGFHKGTTYLDWRVI